MRKLDLINVGDEGIKIKLYNYNVNNILVEIFQFKVRNNIPLRGRYKNVKIQHTILTVLYSQLNGVKYGV